MQPSHRPSLIRSLLAASFSLTLLTSAAVAQPDLSETDTVYAEYLEQEDAHLGEVIVTADFNGDGYEDMAVGVPDYDADILEDAGLVVVFHGSPSGLKLAFVEPGNSAGDNFGAALAASDLQGIGHKDWLFVGEPGADFAHVSDGGAVHLYQYTTRWRYETTWRQGVDFVQGGMGTGDNFGASIAAADFNGDGRGDVVVGAPKRRASNHDFTVHYPEAGGINYFYSNVSQSGTPRLSFFKTATHLGSDVKTGAHFGTSLAAGDFDGDGNVDLAIGAPGYSVGALSNAGRVHIDYALGTDDVLYDSDVGGTTEAGDEFGAALASGDFDRSLFCFVLESCATDLAIGIPGEDSEAGRLAVAYGTGGGVGTGNNVNFYQHNASTLTSAEPGDRFASTLKAMEIDNRLGWDLAVGAPDEAWNSVVDQGIAHLMFGGASGLGSYPGMTFVAVDGTTSAPGEAGDRLGAGLGGGDFNGNGTVDLAIGVPGRTTYYPGLILNGGDPEEPASGIVLIFGGPFFDDGFESGDMSRWSSSSP